MKCIKEFCKIFAIMTGIITVGLGAIAAVVWGVVKWGWHFCVVFIIGYIIAFSASIAHDKCKRR